jgi:chromosome segregation protein
LRLHDDESLSLSGQLDAARTELQTCRGRQSSLEALQDAALESGDDAVAGWVERHQLQDVPRLLDAVEVDAGWERAVEAVLDEALGALCVQDLEAYVADLDCGPVMLLGTASSADVAVAADSLLARLRCPWPVAGLLAGVRVADSLEQAVAGRGNLAPGERIVTRDGALVGREWLRSAAGEPEIAGSIARAEELRELQITGDELERAIAELLEQQQGLSDKRHQLELDRDEALQRVARLSRERASMDAEIGAGRSRIAHLRERAEGLRAERVELEEARELVTAEIEAGRERLYRALERTEVLSAARDELSAERDAMRAAVEAARGEERQLRDERQRLTVAIETRRASCLAIETALDRGRQQLSGLHARRDELLAALEQETEPLAEQREQLDAQLELRLDVERELADARNGMEALDQALREAEQRRHRLEQAASELQRDLDAERLARQELLVRRRTLEEQSAERDCSLATVLSGLDADISPSAREQELIQLRGRVQRLGNINLAAIDEFNEQSERLRYLDQQQADITTSLQTLEAAIRKIDRETRSRFQETFERVNQGLQQLFPRVFGGGHAYLELTGDDLLDTGVAIMARPPGKRNSSIHLLSGGEKALTAVALVFAIFQLNPAPFCMLDEVDAPLDDANVGRFCDLVRSMSDQVQFIFVTHNKVTMEIADHLIGVTMHEPGCSRLVSVDVEEAARMAAVS